MAVDSEEFYKFFSAKQSIDNASQKVHLIDFDRLQSRTKRSHSAQEDSVPLQGTGSSPVSRERQLCPEMARGVFFKLLC